MQKSQIIILVIAIIAVIFLFNLPKHIVKDNRQTQIQSTVAKTEGSETEEGEAHSLEISEKDKEKLEILRKNYFAVSEKEKKLKFADSLAAYFKKLNAFDSSAKYKEEIAILFPTKENLILAGDAYFEASTYAIDQKKGVSLASKARAVYEEAGKNTPQDLSIQTKLAKTYMVAPDSENPMKGILMLREVVEKDPKNVEALMSLGRFSLQVNKYDNAVERFTALLKVEPDNAEAELLLGYSYMMLKNKEKAKASFERAKKLSNDENIHQTIDEYLKELK